MTRSPARLLRLAFVALLALAALLGSHPAQAAAEPLDLSQLLQPDPAAVIPPVAEPMTADPAGRARGTMILVHAGGWAGHDAHAQRLLMERPGQLLLASGWRVVSLDYEEGTAGLQDVLDAAGKELQRNSTDGPICIYGESAGAHLALVAAKRLRSIDCVIGLGAPTDLSLYESEAAASPDLRLKLVASQIDRFFGSTSAQRAPWNLVSLAPSIHADVLLMREADDDVVSAQHDAGFRAARPTTQLVDLQAGNRGDPGAQFVHGTVSDAGRGRYVSTIRAFAGRAAAAHRAERRAARTKCTGVARTVAEIGLERVRSTLRCLARKDRAARRAGSRNWRRSSVRLHGEVNAARIWSALRRTQSGRRALSAAGKRRAKVTIRTGAPSRVVLRATR